MPATPDSIQEPRLSLAERPWAVVAAVLVALFLAYGRTIRVLIQDWNADPNYSVGMIVPLAALYLLWIDRDRFRRLSVRPAWVGLVVLAAAQAARLLGLAFLYESVERYSLLLTLVGLVILIGGWQLFRATRWILLLLVLMIPFPAALHNRISSPLQGVSTAGAVATLELLGVTVSQEGHTLTLNDRVPVAVAEACSGLRMLTAFIFVCAVFAYVIQRPRWQKVVILLSCIPIAILSNLIRLVLTSLLYLWTSDKIASRFFHDFAGWTMMPLAIAILMGELWLMRYLVTEDRLEPSQTIL